MCQETNGYAAAEHDQIHCQASRWEKKGYHGESKMWCMLKCIQQYLTQYNWY